jgi:hypothetical protein
MLFAVPIHAIVEVEAETGGEAKAKALALLPDGALGRRTGPAIESPVARGETPPPPSAPLPRVNRVLGGDYHLRPRAK